MPQSYDVIVLGLGAMGSAAVCRLAQAGARVLGIEQFLPSHAFGSSHGKSRIIREAYFEHPAYVPLVQRAYELWAELERDTGESLLLQTGGLMIGPEGGVVFEGARRSAREHRLAHEVLSAAAVRERFPALQPAPHFCAVWEPRAGILFPERCVHAHLALARRHGAHLHLDEPVLAWERDGSEARVETSRGSYRAAPTPPERGRLAARLAPRGRPISHGGKADAILVSTARPAGGFSPGRCPVHLWEHEPGQFFYGFPDLGDGVKLAGHHQGERVDPNRVDRELNPAELASFRNVVQRYVPDANGPLRSATVCLYTNMPDQHFLIDRVPDIPQALVASPCSGHGFKFSSAIGEVLADELLGRPPRFDLSLFRWR